jgi:NADH-quinone oxidoreductase subunit L
MTFFGEYRGHAEEGHGHGHGEPHEAPWNMYAPLICLAVLSLAVGWLATPWWHTLTDWMHHSFPYVPPHDPPPYSLMYGLMAVAVVLGIFGLTFGWFMIHRKPELTKAFVAKFPKLHKAAENKFYVDEAYQAAVIEPFLKANVAAGRFDNDIIDGAVNLSAHVTERTSHGVGLFDNEVVDGSVNGVADGVLAAGGKVRRAQTGNVRTYITLALLGAIVTIAVFAVVIIIPRILPS